MIAGFDFSTRHVDVVFVPDEPWAKQKPEWVRWGIASSDGAFFAARNVRLVVPGPSFWEATWLIGIENPYSNSMANAKKLGYIAGALACRLPQDICIVQVEPSEWKKETAGLVFATKEATAEWSIEHGGDPSWPQDAHDAHCVAHTVRALNQRAIEAA